MLLDEPYTRQLRGKLRELRFHLARQAVRISYWVAADRRIILLTVFRKQRMREDAEVQRPGGRCSGVSPRRTRRMRGEVS